MRAIRASLVGATGYAGGELCALLAGHSGVEIAGLYRGDGCGRIQIDRAGLLPRIRKLGAWLERGFFVGTARQRVLRLLPPYVVPKKALTEFLVTLPQILMETRR